MGLIATAAWAQSSSEELAIAQKTEQWTFWMMVTGVASAVFASLSVVGLVWTFREQRKLTHAQERAFLDIKDAELMDHLGELDPSIRQGRHGVFKLFLDVQNTGRTHAFDISGVALLYMAGDVDGPDLDTDSRRYSPRRFHRFLYQLTPASRGKIRSIPEIAPGETRKLTSQLSVKSAEAYKETREGWSDLIVVISYRDIYGRRHHVQLRAGTGADEIMKPVAVHIERTSGFGRYVRRIK